MYYKLLPDVVLSTGTGRKKKAYKILVREILRKYPYGRSKNRLDYYTTRCFYKV
jgi:hypothetical protein